MAIVSLCTHMTKRIRALQSPFYRSTNLAHEGPTLMTWPPPTGSTSWYHHIDKWIWGNTKYSITVITPDEKTIAHVCYKLTRGHFNQLLKFSQLYEINPITICTYRWGSWVRNKVSNLSSVTFGVWVPSLSHQPHLVVPLQFTGWQVAEPGCESKLNIGARQSVWLFFFFKYVVLRISQINQNR